MIKKGEGKAKADDVERRFEARMWLTEAIQRAQRDGINVAPGADLLAALEDLDAIEIVERFGEPEEQVVHSNCVGPAGTSIQEGQVMRLIGKTDPMLTLPETSDTVVSGKAGGRYRTPAELWRLAFAAAVVTRLKELGMAHGSAIAFVEEELGPTESNLKKMRAGPKGDAMVDEYNEILATMHFEAKNKTNPEAMNDVIFSLVRVSELLGQK